MTPEPAAGKPDWPEPAGGLQRFYLGCPEPSWLRGEGVGWLDGSQGLALFVCHRRLARLRTLPRAGLPWACDSGGFTELRAAGYWRVSAADYTRAVARYDREIGLLEWAAPMDWLCEPGIRARTGLSIREHQDRTVGNYLLLRELWSRYSGDSCPFMPVIQGWSIEDYLDRVSLYSAAGVGLPGRGVRRRR